MSIPQTPSPLANIVASKTYNAAWFSGNTSEAQITAAIAAAVADGALYVYVPASMLPYTASAVTFNTSVQMLREGSGSVGDVKAYGAAADGITDDTIAIKSAISATLALGGGTVFFPASAQFYRVATSFTLPSGVVLTGASRASAILKRDQAGDMITSIGARAGLRSITLDGNNAIYPTTGRGVVVASSGTVGIVFFDIEIKNFPLACLDFAVADAGSEFTSIASSYFTSGAIGTVAAIKISGTDTAAAPRKFYATTSSGCTLFDFGGANDLFASGFYTNGFIFGPTSSHVMLTNFRCGAAAGAVTIKGGSHEIMAAVFAIAVILDVSCTALNMDAEVASYNITDNGSVNYFRIGIASWVPAWTGATSNPVIGNGTIVGMMTRIGGDVTVSIRITIGSTTTLGSGQWFISLPYLDASPYRYVGTFWSKISATSVRNTGVARVVPGQKKIEAVFNASSTPWSPAQPIAAPVAGDEYEIYMTYHAA